MALEGHDANITQPVFEKLLLIVQDAASCFSRIKHKQHFTCAHCSEGRLGKISILSIKPSRFFLNSRCEA